MKFECTTCNKVFFKKYNYNRHLGRKNPCKPKKIYSKIFQNIPESSKIFHKNIPESSKIFHKIEAGIDLSTIIENKFETEYKKNKVGEKLIKKIVEEKLQNKDEKERLRIEKKIMRELEMENKQNKKIIKEIEIEKGLRFECQYCDRSYKQKYNLTKHLKKCKVKKQQESIQSKKEKFEESIALDIAREDKIVQEVKKLLDEHDTRLTAGTTNITNISGNQNNNIINITLNDYGNEDMIKLDPKKTYKRILNKILNSGIYGIQKYIQYKYCNPEQPQNLTIKYTNNRSNNLMIRKQDEWIPRDKHEVIDELYDRDNNVEEVLKAYEKVNNIDKFEEDLDIIQQRFLKNIDPFYTTQIEPDDAEKIKEVKNETLNDFLKCYRKNKNVYDSPENCNPEITIEH